MNATEKRATVSLASIYALRMFGLFIILPVFSLFAHDNLAGATPALIGLALGAYGLTMAIFQIPFGIWSDRLGRKPVIAIGLLIFAIGSVVAALSTTIWGVIIGRAIQGAGAIPAAVMALLADLTRAEERTKAMATIGMSIGASFAISLIAGPMLSQWLGVPGIFWLIGFFGLVAIGVLYFVVPEPGKLLHHSEVETSTGQLLRMAMNRKLMPLNLGIMFLHWMMMAMFTVLPFALRDSTGLTPANHWHIYLPVLLLSVVGMVPCIIVAEKKHKMKPILLGAIVTLGIANLLMAALHASLWGVVVSLLLFFTAFNIVEASLPSLISRLAPAESRGTAMGVYSTAQFMGAFMGGTSGGFVYTHWGLEGVFVGCAVLALLWVVSSINLETPTWLSSKMVDLSGMDVGQMESLRDRLTQLGGVTSVVILIEEGTAFLKVDKRLFDEASLDACVAGVQTAPLSSTVSG